MRPVFLRSCALLFVLSLVVVGCTGGGDGTTGDDLEPTGDDNEAPTDVADAGERVENEAATPSGRMVLKGFRDDNPTGVSVEVTSIEVGEGGHLLLGIDVINVVPGGQVDIGQYRNVLVDDRGNYYEFQRPEDNEWLSVPKDHRMTGTLAFAGPVDPEATHLTFALNQEAWEDRVGAADDGRLDRTPRFLVEDLPLPGIGLEEEAADPDALGIRDAPTVEVGLSENSEDNPEVTVTVVSYETDGRATTIDIEAVNRSNTQVRLLVGTPSLRDDLGRRLQYLRVDSEEGDERVLRLQPGEEGAATMAFRGGPSAGSQELHLVLNSLHAGDGNETAPGFRFTLPVPERQEP